MTSARFFRILDDTGAENRWFLRGPSFASGGEVDPGVFTRGIQYDDATDFVLGIRRPGRPLAITFGDFEVPIANFETAEIISRRAEESLQVLPAILPGYDMRLFILNCTRIVSCLDERRSDFERWKADSARPEKAGCIRTLARLRIDPSHLEREQIFRVKEWPLALVVSSHLHDQLRLRGVTGVVFERVD